MNSNESFVQACNNGEIQPKVVFIGGGNMASAMVRGFLKNS
jgi:hypothetical protein